MILDTEKNGQDALWRLYQIASIEELLIHEERTSREVWFDIGFKGVVISRASVINFLNKLVDDGLATYRDKSGKGGFHRVYHLTARTWDEFNETIIDKILYKLWEIFPANEKISSVISA